MTDSTQNIRDAARTTVEHFVARALLAKGDDLFPFLEKMSFVKQMAAVDAINSYAPLPAELKALLVVDPCSVGKAITEDAALHAFWLKLTQAEAGDITMADKIQATFAAVVLEALSLIDAQPADNPSQGYHFNKPGSRNRRKIGRSA